MPIGQTAVPAVPPGILPGADAPVFPATPANALANAPANALANALANAPANAPANALANALAPGGTPGGTGGTPVLPLVWGWSGFRFCARSVDPVCSCLI